MFAKMGILSLGLLLGLWLPAHAGWQVETVAGSGESGMWQGAYAGDHGPASAARLNNPQGVAVDGEGNLYIADTWNHRIRKVDRDGIITTVAGTGAPGYGGDCELEWVPAAGRRFIPILNCPAQPIQLSYPHALAINEAGDLLIADTGNHRVRRLALGGTAIFTVAGNGQAGNSGDGGPASEAGLNGPMGLALDRAGNLYISDQNHNTVRRVGADGIIATVAGKAELWEGFSGDGGPAVAAQLYYPGQLAVDRLGNLLIADMGNNRIRRVGPDGVIQTLAGSERSGIFQGGDWGDLGPAIKAGLDLPEGVASDRQGNLYLADSNNHRIRRVDVYGVISAVAGGERYGLADGPGQAARFFQPAGLAVDKTGNLYVADRFNHRIRKLSLPVERPCEGRADFYLPIGHIPAGNLRLPFVDAMLPGQLLTLEVLMQQVPVSTPGPLRLTIAQFNPVSPQAHPDEPSCHAVYVDSEQRTLHVPYVDLRPLDEFGNPTTPSSTYQVDLQWLQSGEFELREAERLR